MQRIHPYLFAAACSAAVALAACGGGGSTLPSVHTTPTPAATATPTVLPSPQSTSNTQSVALSTTTATQATLPVTGGIATTVTIPKVASGSGSIAVTVATGSKATMSRARQALSRRPMAMAGGPYLLQLDFVPTATVSLTAAPGFSLDLSQYVTASGLTISQTAAYLQSQSVYVGVVDDAGNFNTFGPLTIDATSTALTVTYTGPSVAVTLLANEHYTIGVHIGAIAAPTSSPAPTPSVTPTSTGSPTPSPAPTPLASPSISLFPLASIYGGSAIAKGITADAQGNVWFTENPGNINAGDGFISSITAAGTITFDTYSPTNEPTHPSGIAFAPDGSLWATEDCGGADFDAFSGSGVYQQSYFINGTTASLCGGAWTNQLIAGSDGNLWFAEGTQKVGKVSTSGSATEYALPDAGYTVGITNGPNGEVWFAEQLSVPGNANAGGELGKVTSTGQVVTYPLHTGEVPGGITLGNDGNLWFTYGTQTTATGVGKMTPDGQETDYTPSTTGEWGGSSEAIMNGPDGKIWFGGSGVLATIDPASGTTATYSISTSQCPNGGALQLVSVPVTNSLWFTSSGCIGEAVLH